MTNIEAMKQWLEALEGLLNKTSGQAIYSFMETERRIAMSACVGLRQAIATEESSATQEQCQYPNCDYPCMNLPDCKDGIKWSDYESDGRIIKNYPKKDNSKENT